MQSTQLRQHIIQKSLYTWQTRWSTPCIWQFVQPWKSAARYMHADSCSSFLVKSEQSLSSWEAYPSTRLGKYFCRQSISSSHPTGRLCFCGHSYELAVNSVPEKVSITSWSCLKTFAHSVLHQCYILLLRLQHQPSIAIVNCVPWKATAMRLIEHSKLNLWSKGCTL